MSERCQKKFTENNSNQNYIIYTGIFAGLVAVFYFYRFHFATIVVSYAIGCLACYFGLKSSALHQYLEKLKQNHLSKSQKEEQDDVLTKGCTTCGSTDCPRHDPAAAAEPWTGLRIHKQLDQAIEDFYNTILDQFINAWYSKITPQPFFVDELRHQLRYASACLLRRAVKINYSRFITERLLPCAMRHFTLCADLPDNALLDSKMAIHPAAANRNAELKYLRSITNAIMPYLLRSNDLDNSVFRVLVREIFAGWVLLSLTDVLCDPHILNTLVVLATGDETMAQLPTTPNYRVEFLETFVRHTESVYTQRAKLLKIDLDMVLNDQDYFYAFMQYMKSTSHIHLLQFYKDIKSFQTKILNPDLPAKEEASLINEAWDMYVTYFDTSSPSFVQLDPSLGVELKLILSDQVGQVKRLQTSRALYQAARQSHSALDKIMLPRFLHSEEFYKLVIGSRIPTGYQKQLTKKQQETLVNSALRLTNKLKGALKSQTLDGQVLESYSNSSTEASEDGVDIDILKYLDTIASDESLREQDLSNCKVVLTNVETRLQAPPRRGTVRVFTLAVHRAEPVPSFWSVCRSEHDFHLLRSKMHEFHGEGPLHDLPLPSRRDNSPMETLRYKYEDFIQRLLQKSILQTSELLHLFLTVDSEFALVVQASSLSATSTDFTNIYQSVTHKLRKEKGQHLESFLRNYLVSADVERFQTIKIPHVEEALEVNEEVEPAPPPYVTHDTRDIHDTVFRDNFGVEPRVFVGRAAPHDGVAGFSQCLMFLLLKIIKARSLVSNLVGSVLSLTRAMADEVFTSLLDSGLRNLLSERRLAHLIKLGQALIFGKKPSSRTDPSEQRELARRQLLASIPATVVTVAGAGVTRAVSTAFEIVQRPQLNKQLVYNLLDLCLVELFPELAEETKAEEPKS